jgi:hypothetical protein
MLAFKIFREKDTPPLKERNKAKVILEGMKPPYGIFLDDRHCMGSSAMSAFDAALLAAAHSQTNTRVYTLPVVTKILSEIPDAEDAEDFGWFSTAVYPFADEHVNLLLHIDTGEANEVANWLKGVANVPFYSQWHM